MNVRRLDLELTFIARKQWAQHIFRQIAKRCYLPFAQLILVSPLAIVHETFAVVQVAASDVS